MSGLSAPKKEGSKIGCGAVVLILLALAGFGIAGYLCFQTYQFTSEAVYIGGEFIGMDIRTQEKKDSDGHAYTETSYYPVVGYALTDAEKYSVKGKFSVGEYAYSEGQEVEVMYLPNDPREARINSFREIWGVAGIFAFIGLVFAGLASLTIFLSKG